MALVVGMPVFMLEWRPGLFLVEVLAFLVPAWVYMRLMRGRWDGVFAVGPRTALGLVLAIPAAVGIWVVADAFGDWVTQLVLDPDRIREIKEQLWGPVAICGTVEEWIWTILGVVVAPAIAEEVLFRGVIQRGLARRWRPWPALLITSFIFAAFHFPLLQFPVFFVLGLEFGWLYQRSGSVWPGILAHAANNLLAIVDLNVPAISEGLVANLGWLRLIVGSLFGAAVALVFFGVLTRGRRPRVAKVIVLPETLPGGPTRP